MKKIILTILISSFCLLGFSQLPNFDRPCGIYTKGAAQPGQYLAAMRNYPFVDGHLLLMRWEQIEIGKDTFDFSVIDQAVQTLQVILGRSFQTHLLILHKNI